MARRAKTVSVEFKAAPVLTPHVVPLVFAQVTAIMDKTHGCYSYDREQVLKLLAFYYGCRLEKI